MKIRDYIEAGKTKDELFNSLIYCVPLFIMLNVCNNSEFFDLLTYSIKHIWPLFLLLLGLIVFFVVVSNILFLIFGYILYLFSKNETLEKVIKNIIAFLIILPFALLFIFQLGQIFDFISFKAQGNILKTAYVFIGIGVVVTLIVIFKKYIVNFFKNVYYAISNFLKTENYIKVIPIACALLSGSYFYKLIAIEAERMKLDLNYNGNLSTYSLCMVLVPVFVYLLSGVIFYKIYDRFKSNKLKIIIKVINIIIYIIAFLLMGSFIIKVLNPSALVSIDFLLFFGILLGIEITLFFFIFKSVLEIIGLVRGDYYEEE